MPAAIWIGALHAPLAHRWKAVPAMQFQAPSLVHEPERVPAEPEPEPDPDPEPVLEPEPVPAGAAAEVVGDALPLPLPPVAAGESDDDGAGCLVDVASVVGEPEPPPGTVTNTPPGREADDEEEALREEEGELEVPSSGVKDAAPVRVLVALVAVVLEAMLAGDDDDDKGEDWEEG